MSRSGYTDDFCEDTWAYIRWRGAVKNAIKGRRGQLFLKELKDALDKLENKKLISGELEIEGEVCALGAVAKFRHLNTEEIDSYDQELISKVFEIPRALACEIMWENDEFWRSPELRFQHMYKWVLKNLRVSE